MMIKCISIRTAQLLDKKKTSVAPPEHVCTVKPLHMTSHPTAAAKGVKSKLLDVVFTKTVIKVSFRSVSNVPLSDNKGGNSASGNYSDF